MVRKITISLPDELLEALDSEAAELGMSRSGVVQEASAHYLAHARGERTLTQRTQQADDLIGWLEELSARPSLDTRPTLEILRDIRGAEDDGDAQ